MSCNTGKCSFDGLIYANTPIITVGVNSAYFVTAWHFFNSECGVFAMGGDVDFQLLFLLLVDMVIILLSVHRYFDKLKVFSKCFNSIANR